MPQAPNPDSGRQKYPPFRFPRRSARHTKFVFTDLEGPTGLWEKNPKGMQPALTHHDEILRETIEEHGGFVFKTVGDTFCAAFPTALGALNSAPSRSLGWACTSCSRMRCSSSSA